MDSEEALSALLHAARRQVPLAAEELESAHTLLKELGCLAVALIQAGTYCHELSYSFTQYLSLFYAHRAELMRRAEPSSLDNYERGAYTTLDISYSALSQVAREFLRFISFYHHTDIPLAALATAAEYDFEDSFSLLPRPEAYKGIIVDLKRLLCAEGNWSEMLVQDTLRTLLSFSLLSITSIEEAVFLQLHPLIQSWLRDMDPPTSQHYRLMVVQIITPCSRDSALRLYRYLIPHLLDMLGQRKGEELHINDLIAAGKILQKQGHHQAAAGVFETALEVIKKTSKPVKQSTMSAWLAEVYKDQGQWSKAEKLEVEALEQKRRILGREHPDTLRVAGNLAPTYEAQGRWSEAEEAQWEVLEQWRILGRETPETITAARNLGATCSHQGRWSEAEKLQVEALEQHRRITGREHPQTIRAAANLASTYWNQGRWSEAEVLEVEALEQQKRILGREHPHAINAAGNLALPYQVQGRWNEAEKVEVEVLGQRRRILGNEHPDTITAAVNLAVTYSKQGRSEEGAALLVPAVQLSLKVLGQQHPHTQLRLRSLVAVYEQLGKEKEAQETRDLLIS